jgi:hypothetical protein
MTGRKEPECAPSAPMAQATVSMAELRRALDATRVAASSDRSRPSLSSVIIQVEAGKLTLFGRDHHRAHWSWLPAETAGRAAVAISKADAYRLRAGRGNPAVSLWARAAALTLGELTIPATPTSCPSPIDIPSSGGVIVSRSQLLQALREGLAEIELRWRKPECLIGGCLIPVQYGNGSPFSLLLDRKLLREAVKSGTAPEMCLEVSSPEAPVCLTSGDFLALIAPRSRESLL